MLTASESLSERSPELLQVADLLAADLYRQDTSIKIYCKQLFFTCVVVYSTCLVSHTWQLVITNRNLYVCAMIKVQ